MEVNIAAPQSEARHELPIKKKTVLISDLIKDFPRPCKLSCEKEKFLNECTDRRVFNFALFCTAV